MGQPAYFNSNIQFFLDQIIRYFEGIHDTHDAAKTAYEQYRTEGRQYCLYLRNFVLSGLSLNINIERNSHLYGLSSTDRGFRQIVKKGIEDHINSLSFVNIRDLYPTEAEGVSDQYTRDFTIPSFRVLNHNWRGVVTEAIKGAKLIVLNLEIETEGIQFEVDTVRECGMAHRTVCVVRGKRGKQPSPLGDFYDVIEVPSPGPVPKETPEVQRLKDAIKHLANDDFTQTTRVRDLSDFKCHVIEKNIDMAAAQFSPELLAGVAYEDYVPTSLANNWELLSQHYPKMVEHWGAIDEMMRLGRGPSVEQLTNIMYEALGTFYLAVTLERYEEMAYSVGTVGFAHRVITGREDIMVDCYGHGAKCAAWAGDTSLAKFYGDVRNELLKK
jgi:hypothetical protein